MDNKSKIGMFDIAWKTNERVAKYVWSLMTDSVSAMVELKVQIDNYWMQSYQIK